MNALLINVTFVLFFAASSRSGSPSSRIPQLGITSTSSTSGQQRRKTTGIPHSQGASRETSPSRSGIGKFV